MLYNHTKKERNKLKKKYKQGFKYINRGFYQYLTEHNDSNDEADENDTLNDFKALIISINNTQEPKPLENTKHFFISFSSLICDNVIQITTYLVD
jgi:hypothetical protein